MDMEKLEEKLERAAQVGRLPKVVIPVHLAGASCDMEELDRLSRKYGFSVIEDASHAIGGSYKGKPVGNCQYSKITVFSFHPVKIITTGEGGAALTRNPGLSNRLNSIRCHGIVREDFEYDSPGPWYYEQQSLGYNYRLTDLQASLGLSQLRRLPTIIERRRELVDRYRKMLQGSSATILEESELCKSSHHLAVLKIDNATPKQHRLIFEGMRNAGIGVQLHYWPIPLQPYFRKLGFSQGQFPNAEHYAKTCFSLPLFPEMSHEDQDRVINILLALLNDCNFSAT